MIVFVYNPLFLYIYGDKFFHYFSSSQRVCTVTRCLLKSKIDRFLVGEWYFYLFRSNFIFLSIQFFLSFNFYIRANPISTFFFCSLFFMSYLQLSNDTLPYLLTKMSVIWYSICLSLDYSSAAPSSLVILLFLLLLSLIDV